MLNNVVMFANDFGLSSWHNHVARFAVFAIPIILAITLIIICTRQFHVLQQNSYFAKRYVRNLKTMIGFKTIISLLVTVGIIAFVWSDMFYFRGAFNLPQEIYLLFRASGRDFMVSHGYLESFVIALFFIGIIRAIYTIRKQKSSKKPLVFTARVKRMYVTLTVLQAGLIAMFLVFNWDLRILFTIQALKLLFTPIEVIAVRFVNAPIERAINRYYVNDAKKILKSCEGMTIIGITGSYGKTSTKHFLGHMLESKFNVTITPGSYNTTLGVVRTVREHLPPIADVFVVEMGAKVMGDIKELAELAKPQIGILTAIGPQHLDTMYTQENITKTKFELYDSVVARDGLMFLNVDNEIIAGRENVVNSVKYGTNADNGAGVYADNIKIGAHGSTFDIVNGERRISVSTKLLGKLNILNIVAAAAVGMHLGLEDADIVQAVATMPTVAHRLELKPFKNGSTLIDDSYNSNPVGCIEAANVLGSFESKRKIAVTPGLVELGAEEFEANRNFGAALAKNATDVILVGPKRSHPIRKGMIEAGFDENNLTIVTTFKDALPLLDKMCDEDTVVLFENDLPDNYER